MKKVLEKKAEVYSELLVDAARSTSKSIRTFIDDTIAEKESAEDLKLLFKNVDDKKINDLFYEFVFLFLHMAGRQSFQLLGDEKKSIFMDRLVLKVLWVISKGSESDYTPFASEHLIMEAYNERLTKYSEYSKLFSQSNEPTEDVLMPNFSFQMSKILIGEDDLRLAMPIELAAGRTILDLKLKDLLQV